MRSRIRRVATAALLAGLLASGCTQVEEVKHKAVEPYTKEAVGTSGLYRIRLAQSAVERLDVTTTLVVEASTRGGLLRPVIPYSGLIYDLNGETWTYTSPEPLVYIRERIEVDHIADGRVFMIRGPTVGTPVVTAGAAELFGIEFGLGK